MAQNIVAPIPLEKKSLEERKKWKFSCVQSYEAKACEDLVPENVEAMAVIVAGTMAMALALSLSVSESVCGPSMLLSVAQALACALRRLWLRWLRHWLKHGCECGCGCGSC